MHNDRAERSNLTTATQDCFSSPPPLLITTGTSDSPQINGTNVTQQDYYNRLKMFMFFLLLAVAYILYIMYIANSPFYISYLVSLILIFFTVKPILH